MALADPANVAPQPQCEEGEALLEPEAGEEGEAFCVPEEFLDDAPAEDSVAESETSTAPAGPEPEVEEDPFDEASIFGDESELELDELPESGDANASKGGFASRLPGDLRFEFAASTSLYVDLDDVTGISKDSKRWSKDYSKERGGIGRNENRLEFYLSYTPTPKVQLVGGIEPVFMGASGVSELDDLSSRQIIKPFHVESDKAYLAFLDIAPGLDIKIGRQIVQWGVADKFNPTNNINPDDLEDRPLFNEPIANQMLVIDYSRWEDKLQLQAIWVPIFYPALLPPSASNALKDPRSPVPFARQQQQDDLTFVQDWLDVNRAFVPEVFATVKTPQPHVRNSQGAFKIASALGEVDISASYYYGFHDIPLPVEATSETTLPEGTQLADLPIEERVPGCCFRSDVTLIYPRMHVIGFDFATQIPWLKDMGFWAETGIFVPAKQQNMRIEMPLGLQLPSLNGAGVAAEFEGPVALRRPFVKLTTGADYTVGKHVLLLAQYMHGFIDEFGANNMGDYMLAGTQMSFMGRHVIAQLFGVIDFPKLGDGRDKASFVIAPELALVPPSGYLTFKLGGFAFIGDTQSKFGQRATGTSIAYMKMQGRF